MEDELLRSRTRVVSPALLPELALHVAEEIMPLWELTAAGGAGAPPYWAFPWVGGQALARHLLDHPTLVLGKRVLDLGAGSGLLAIAAARAGARSARASDVDAGAVAAIGRNAALNGVTIEAIARDLLDDDVDDEVILAGDLWYEPLLATRVFAFLERHRGTALILIGDPGRAYFNRERCEEIGRYVVPTTIDLEGRGERVAGVFRLR